MNVASGMLKLHLGVINQLRMASWGCVGLSSCLGSQCNNYHISSRISSDKSLSKCQSILHQGSRSYPSIAAAQAKFTSENKDLPLDSDVMKLLPQHVRSFVEEKVKWLQPARLHLCDGSLSEYKHILKLCETAGVMKRLPKYDNCWLTLTDPADVARVESKTVIATEKQRDAVAIPKDGSKSQLGNWMSIETLQLECNDRFPGSMKGRTMYIIPFSMGPASSPLSKLGVQLTDSPYVVASMRIMTRMGKSAMDSLQNGRDFVKCVHTVGQPIPVTDSVTNNWPCNPAKTLIAHVPQDNEILSYGSGYGGNSLLGKKCFALRLGSILARREGWLAEHMLIVGITNPEGKKKYFAAAFPSACGKTNLAMLLPTLPGYKVECVGDDIAWMKFDEDGRLRAINPENGFFGVAPGTSNKTNPNAMKTIQRNTVFTNVAETSDGGVFWEGLEEEVDLNKVRVTDWQGQPWSPDSNRLASHPNSRFCVPASQCPLIDPEWENPKGVPIEAIFFGGRRPQGVPLVYEAKSWSHGVFLGAAMRSEATAAAEHKGKVIMHDPFAMRPFFAYNFGDYLKHWLSFQHSTRKLHLPRIFHVNWFRKSVDGKFLWPGFGDNIRVLDWIFRRVDNAEDIATLSPIGYLPKPGSINISGLQNYKHLDMKELFSLPTDFWKQEMQEIRAFFINQVGNDLPEEILAELDKVEKELAKL